MTPCSPEPVWTEAYVWACACGHAYDHSGRRTINDQHTEHLAQGDPMTTTAPNRTLTNAGRRELDRSNLAMVLRLPAATPMPGLLDRVRDLVAEREAFDLGRLQADLAALDDQATGLAHFLAEQLGEHVDDQGDETQIQTVKRLLGKVRGETP